MPRTYAEERTKITVLTEAPVNVLKPTVAELEAGVDIECRIHRAESRLSATASDTFSEPLYCEGGNPTDFGASNFEGTLTIFWWLDETGKSEPLDDIVMEMFREKGTEVWIYLRVGPRHDIAWTAGDAPEYYHAKSDNPQAPSDPNTGYIKKVVPLGIQGDSKVSGVEVVAGL